MSENFTGRWLVSEYVYNPDGIFAGIVHQKRYVQRISDTHLRVIQDCEPSEALQAHPMARFAGHWEFDLQINQNRREYHGVDVVGYGMPYGANAMLGQGIWTRFGYNFTSFGFLTSPTRQLTGGAFFEVDSMVARIVGIGVAETDDALDQFPTLSHHVDIAHFAGEWYGIHDAYDNDGNEISSSEFNGTIDQEGNLITPDLCINFDQNRKTLSGTILVEGKEIDVFGKRMQYGSMIDDLLYTSSGNRIRSKFVLDTEIKQLVVLQKAKTSNNNEIISIIALQHKK